MLFTSNKDNPYSSIYNISYLGCLKAETDLFNKWFNELKLKHEIIFCSINRAYNKEVSQTLVSMGFKETSWVNNHSDSRIKLFWYITDIKVPQPVPLFVSTNNCGISMFGGGWNNILINRIKINPNIQKYNLSKCCYEPYMLILQKIIELPSGNLYIYYEPSKNQE